MISVKKKSNQATQSTGNQEILNTQDSSSLSKCLSGLKVKTICILFCFFILTIIGQVTSMCIIALNFKNFM